MIFTRSSFFYGPEINENNLYIDFNEGSGELSASLDVGGYTISDVAAEVSRILNEIGTLTYTITMDRATRKLTIGASGTFSLLFATGTNLALSAASALGFAATDLSGSASYESSSAIGVEYRPQFKLQDYIALEDWQDLTQANQTESASGVVEVISFATVRFMEANITLANDYDQTGSVIESNPTGVSDLREFIKYITRKLNIEFLPDRDDENTFDKLLLERTLLSRRGVGFKLKELHGRGLVGYFETGTLTFREVS